MTESGLRVHYQGRHSLRRTEPRPELVARPVPKARSKIARNAVDAWMAGRTRLLGSPVSRRTIALWILGAPALVPVTLMAPAVITANTNTMNNAVADVLGTGAEALLLITLLITPIVTITQQRWFVPLRKWYGIMFAVTAITDAIIASITTSFAGGVVGRMAGHSFLLAGFTMVLLAIPLLAISNSPAQRWLGKYWKPLQRMTYVIWALLYVHLALLFGFGLSPAEAGDGDPLFHQRLFQLTACSIPLLLLRLPPVRRWVGTQQKDGRQWLVNFTFLPFAFLFLLGFVFIVNEEIFKGIAAFSLHPISD